MIQMFKEAFREGKLPPSLSQAVAQMYFSAKLGYQVQHTKMSATSWLHQLDTMDIKIRFSPWPI